MCSSTVSDAANMSGHGSTLCSHTVEKILCRSSFRSGHMSAICARLSPKEVGVKRVETLVSTLLPRRGARRIPALRRAQLPAEVQRKTLRPLGTNTLTQFAHPAQPVQRKKRRGNPLRFALKQFELLIRQILFLFQICFSLRKQRI